MNRVVVPLFFVLAAFAADLEAQTQALRGTWQVSEIVITGPGARTITSPQPGLFIFTATHYSVTQVRSEEPRSQPADFGTASADEVRAAWAPFRAQAGTYEVSDTTLTTRPMVAKNPSTMAPGVMLAYAFRLRGDTLWLRQVHGPGGPMVSSATFEYRRIE